jgi:hypothetical protein
MDDFKGHLTNAKCAKLGKCSSDTALRDIENFEIAASWRGILAAGAARVTASTRRQALSRSKPLIEYGLLTLRRPKQREANSLP